MMLIPGRYVGWDGPQKRWVPTEEANAQKPRRILPGGTPGIEIFSGTSFVIIDRVHLFRNTQYLLTPRCNPNPVT